MNCLSRANENQPKRVVAALIGATLALLGVAGASASVPPGEEDRAVAGVVAPMPSITESSLRIDPAGTGVLRASLPEDAGYAELLFMEDNMILPSLAPDSGIEFTEMKFIEENVTDFTSEPPWLLPIAELDGDDH